MDCKGSCAVEVVVVGLGDPIREKGLCYLESFKLKATF